MLQQKTIRTTWTVLLPLDQVIIVNENWFSIDFTWLNKGQKNKNKNIRVISWKQNPLVMKQCNLWFGWFPLSGFLLSERRSNKMLTGHRNVFQTSAGRTHFSSWSAYFHCQTVTELIMQTNAQSWNVFLMQNKSSTSEAVSWLGLECSLSARVPNL